MWEKMKGLGWHRKLHWLIAYGILCTIEFIVRTAKEHVELKFKPKEEEEEDDDGEEPARKKKRR